METELPDGDGVIVEYYGNAAFSREVILRFPTLRADLEADADLLHVQMGTLYRATMEGIEVRDLTIPLQICQFLAEAVAREKHDPEIDNAIAISFVQLLVLRESVFGLRLIEQMPAKVRQILLDQERTYGGNF